MRVLCSFILPIALFAISSTLFLWLLLDRANANATRHLSRRDAYDDIYGSPDFQQADSNDRGNGDDEKHSKDNKDDPPRGQPFESVAVTTTTVVIVQAGGATPSPYNNQILMNNTQSSSVSDPNETGIVDQLHDDQEALHRMALIVSLVGGIGGIAIIASIVVFTRARILKKRRLREQDTLDLQETAAPAAQRLRTADDEDNNSNSNNGGNNNNNSNDHDSTVTPVPSAPPAPSLLLDPPVTRRRHIMSLHSQMAPAPSAPTAKELEQEEPPPRCPHVSSSSWCDDDIPTSPPEAPPPAYTPTAPPFYALPLSVIRSTSSSNSPSTHSTLDDLLPHRDASQLQQQHQGEPSTAGRGTSDTV